MTSMSAGLSEADHFEAEREAFFALIGRCVTSYQQVEEHLLAVFMSALGGDPVKATAIYGTVRSLEARLNVVSAALTGDHERLARWRGLAVRVGAAAAARNHIAHARPRRNGGVVEMVSVGPPDAPGEPQWARRLSPERMELVKGSETKESVWTTEMMRDMYSSTRKLFGHLVAFCMELRGQVPPVHLAEE